MPNMAVPNVIEERTVEREDDYKRFLPKHRTTQDTRSALDLAYAHSGGSVVNACPYGCADNQLDANYKCKHYVGDTPPGVKEVFYPRKFALHITTGKPTEREFTDGSDPRPVLGTDHLERYKTVHRVYRKNGEAPETPPEPVVPEVKLKTKPKA